MTLSAEFVQAVREGRMTPDPTATYEYTGQQEEHRGKAFKYAQSVTIQDVVPVHQFECGDGTTITIKTDRWQDVMKEVKK